VRYLTAIAIVSAFFATSASAVREFLILQEPQPAQRVEGVVLDSAGLPIEGMTVSDCTPKWSKILRSTTTDSKGHFDLSRHFDLPPKIRQDGLLPALRSSPV
jgi:hypothetical protein